MKHTLRKSVSFFAVTLLLVSTVESDAFSLAGPVQPWMQAPNGVYLSPEGAGPMDLGNEYRWNVPVVTYGFDKSFLDFFGTNGVAAVESAIQLLNNLPPASQLTITNYPFDSRHINFRAQSFSLTDLKSQTLANLIGNLGLLSPTPNVYVLRSWDPGYFNPAPANDRNSSISFYGLPIVSEFDQHYIDPGSVDNAPGYITNFVAGFNFDPQALVPSIYVNQVLYVGNILINYFGNNYIQGYLADPLADPFTAVADGVLDWGKFYSGLTYDDAGGLSYLYSTNTINYETLLSNITGSGTNVNSFVNGAWRPGIDKLTFIPQPVGPQPGTFLPTTNQFTDTYITNGQIVQQQLQRVVTQPDFLFSASTDQTPVLTNSLINNAMMNGGTNGAGPGIIAPPVIITFQKAGSYFVDGVSEDSLQNVSSLFGSFDGTTNPPIAYPAPQTGNLPMVVRILLSNSNISVNNPQKFEWSPTSQTGTIYAFQTSTNLFIWNTLFTVTNNGSVCTYANTSANSSARFYRLVPQ